MNCMFRECMQDYDSYSYVGMTTFCIVIFFLMATMSVFWDELTKVIRTTSILNNEAFVNGDKFKAFDKKFDSLAKLCGFTVCEKTGEYCVCKKPTDPVIKAVSIVSDVCENAVGCEKSTGCEKAVGCCKKKIRVPTPVPTPALESESDEYEE